MKIIVQKPFSHHFKMRVIFHVSKLIAFSLQFPFRRDQNHYSNLSSKNHKMCEKTEKIKFR